MHLQNLRIIIITVMIVLGGLNPGTIAQDAVPIGDVQHGKNAVAQWWHLQGVGLTDSNGALQYKGNGRVFIESESTSRIQVGSLTVEAKPDSVLFLDHVEGQIRVMVLRGDADVNDGQRIVTVHLSQQVVVCPNNHPGYFIDDGAYRRQPIEQFEDKNSKTFVRQFYLEQIVYTDPLLRTIYHQDEHAKALIKKLNKTGAILRDLNGTWGYEANQV